MNIRLSLTELTLDPTSLIVGFGTGAAVTALFFGLKVAADSRQIAVLSSKLESEREAMGDHFKVLAQSALQSNTESFLTLAQEKLKAAQKDGEHDLQKRGIAIEQMVKPVEAHLQRMNAMVEELKATDKTIRADLQNLHKETSKLTSALRNPQAQGKWGEFILETILDRANLMKGIHYEVQTGIDNGGRPDVIISIPDGFKIAIDAKAPINEFIARLDEDLSDEDFKSIKMNMAKTVRGHVKALGARTYQDNLVGSDFVILFLPSEAVFSATLECDPTIVDFAAENHVVIASPTLIISLLRVVGLSWRQVELAKNALEISALGAELHKRFTKFMDHFGKIGKSLGGAMESYDSAIGSMNRMVLPAARKFVKLNGDTGGANSLPDIPPLEKPLKSIGYNAELGLDEDEISGNKSSHG